MKECDFLCDENIGLVTKTKSIGLLEKRIEEVQRCENVKTKAAQQELKQIKKTLSKVYFEYKKKLMELEKENRDKLMFLRSTKGFYKLFGNSLYFYAFDIAPKLNVDVKVLSDGDYDEKSEIGVASVRDLAEIEKQLRTLQIKKIATRDKSGNIVIYKLPWNYSDADIRRFTEQNTYEVYKYNHVIIAEDIIPVLYVNLNELMKICYENVRRLEPIARDSLGIYIIKILAEMIRVYIEMANGRINEMAGLDEIGNRLNLIKYQVKIIADLKLWNARTYARIGDGMIKIQGIIDLQKRNNS